MAPNDDPPQPPGKLLDDEELAALVIKAYEKRGKQADDELAAERDWAGFSKATGIGVPARRRLPRRWVAGALALAAAAVLAVVIRTLPVDPGSDLGIKGGEGGIPLTLAVYRTTPDGQRVAMTAAAPAPRGTFVAVASSSRQDGAPAWVTLLRSDDGLPLAPTGPGVRVELTGRGALHEWSLEAPAPVSRSTLCAVAAPTEEQLAKTVAVAQSLWPAQRPEVCVDVAFGG